MVKKVFYFFFFFSSIQGRLKNSSYRLKKDTSIAYTVIYQVLYNHDYSYRTVNPVKKVVTVRSHQHQFSGALLMGHVGRVVNPSSTLAIGTMHVSRMIKINDHRFRGHLRTCEVDSPSNARMVDAISSNGVPGWELEATPGLFFASTRGIKTVSGARGIRTPT